MTDDPLVAGFITWATHDRKRSPHTIRRYNAVLNQLPNPAAATTDDIQAWWDSRLHLSAATRTNELACLRSFYKWATRFDHRTDDPTRRLDAPKVGERIPRAIGSADLTRLLTHATDERPDLRRAIALCAYGGLRVAEAASLDWADVQHAEPPARIYVTGKGDKQRVVALSRVLLDLILPATGGNVTTAGRTPHKPGALGTAINRLMTAEGINHSSHDLRKRGATMALARGSNPEAVRKMFGWASMQTVTHYADIGSEELDKVAEAMI